MVVLIVDMVQQESCATAYKVGNSVKWTSTKKAGYKQLATTDGDFSRLLILSVSSILSRVML